LQLVDDLLVAAEDLRVGVSHQLDRYRVRHAAREQERRRTVPQRVERDPNHLPQCEFITVTDPAVLRVLLKVTDKGDYAWLECGSCGAGWQVAFSAAESAG
jgi:hypothetical protein